MASLILWLSLRKCPCIAAQVKYSVPHCKTESFLYFFQYAVAYHGLLARQLQFFQVAQSSTTDFSEKSAIFMPLTVTARPLSCRRPLHSDMLPTQIAPAHISWRDSGSPVPSFNVVYSFKGLVQGAHTAFPFILQSELFAFGAVQQHIKHFITKSLIGL